MTAVYVATEFAGDPPEVVARWYKAEAGTYARVWHGGVELYNAADLKVELSLGSSVEYVPGDGRPAEVEAVELHRATRPRR